MYDTKTKSQKINSRTIIYLIEQKADKNNKIVVYYPKYEAQYFDGNINWPYIRYALVDKEVEVNI